MVKKLFSHDERTKLSVAEGNCLKLYAKMNVRIFIYVFTVQRTDP